VAVPAAPSPESVLRGDRLDLHHGPGQQSSVNAALPIRLHAGARLRAHVAREGFRLADFGTVLGAAGGPKWLALHGLDRVLAPRLAATGRRVDLVGSSIGGWRFAAWARADPIAALDRLLAAYLAPEHFDPSIRDFDWLFRRYLEALLGEAGAEELCAHEHFAVHLVVASFAASRLPLAGRLGWTALRNAFGRPAFDRDHPLLPRRLLLSTRPPTAGLRRRLPALEGTLAPDGVVEALLATAAVPGLLAPVPGLAPDPARVGVDGGIVDYHFEGTGGPGDGFVLYPHFYGRLVPGWFDKAFRGRHRAPERVDDLLLIRPSDQFVASLPGGRIPDRGDPRRLGPEGCRAAWSEAADAARRLGDALEDVLDRDRVPELLGV
jgi:hypothetical protein